MTTGQETGARGRFNGLREVQPVRIALGVRVNVQGERSAHFVKGGFVDPSEPAQFHVHWGICVVLDEVFVHVYFVVGVVVDDRQPVDAGLLQPGKHSAPDGYAEVSGTLSRLLGCVVYSLVISVRWSELDDDLRDVYSPGVSCPRISWPYGRCSVTWSFMPLIPG